MNIRSSRSTVTFSNAFSLPGYPGELPAGDYDVLAEDELLQGLSFEAYRRTATYLHVIGRGARRGQSELRATTQGDLQAALSRDRAVIGKDSTTETARIPTTKST